MPIGKYEYEDLAQSSDLRILRLQCAPITEKIITCRLLTKSLKQIKSEAIRYEALTWCWGDADFDNVIRIRKPSAHGAQAETFTKSVSESLYQALLALRHEDEDRLLWIDAICINQANIVERNQQVPRMDTVYGQATSVCIWLGVADEHSERALKFIKTQLLDLWSFDYLCKDKVYAQGWESLVEVMKRPWFSRRWVVQEISLAMSAKVYCGRDSVDWNDFSDAISLFVDAEADKRLSDEFKRHTDFGHVPDFFGDVSSLGAAQLVETTRNLFRTATAGRKRIGLSSLENLVSRLSVFEVSDPKDAIYALLAVSRDSNPRSNKNLPDFSDHPKYADKPQQLQHALDVLHKIRKYFPKWQAEEYEVDYTRDVIEVFRDFLAFSIRKADRPRALDIICRPWAPQHDKPLGALGRTPMQDQMGYGETDGEVLRPSWITRTDKASHVLRSFRKPNAAGSAQSSTILKMHRQHADSLVGLPEYSQGNYSAAGTRAFDPKKLWFKRRKDSYSMYVEGFIIDKLDKVEDPSQAGNIPYAWLKYAEWKDKKSDPPAGPWERFWETLVASRGPNGQNPPTFYPRACQQVLIDNPTDSTIETSKIIEGGAGRIVAKFLRRVLATIWERRLVQTRNKRLGLVDRNSRSGDFVCILYGCSVPVILRRHPIMDPNTAAEVSPEARLRWRRAAAIVNEYRSARRSSNNGQSTPIAQFPKVPLTSKVYVDIRTVNTWANFGITAVTQYFRSYPERPLDKLLCLLSIMDLATLGSCLIPFTLAKISASRRFIRSCSELGSYRREAMSIFITVLLAIALGVPINCYRWLGIPRAAFILLAILILNVVWFRFSTSRLFARPTVISKEQVNNLARTDSMGSVDSNASEETLVEGSSASDTAQHEPKMGNTVYGPDRRKSSTGAPTAVDAEPPHYYELIGECFIHGIMNGEAIAWQNERQTKLEKNISRIFDIR